MRFALFATCVSSAGFQSTCDLPGQLVGSGTSHTPASTPQQQIDQIWIAQPFDPTTTGITLVFTMRVQTLSPTPQPSSRWVVYFTRQNADGIKTKWFVAMVTDGDYAGKQPGFVYGHVGPGTTSALDEEYIDGMADSGSFTTDGYITIRMSKPSVNSGGLAFPPFVRDELLSQLTAYTYTSTNALLVTAGSGGDGQYTVVSATYCKGVTSDPSATPPPTATPTPAAILPGVVSRLAPDPYRPRVYATMPDSNAVTVIDMLALKAIATIPVGSDPRGLAVSADGTQLWVADSGSADDGITVIDLASLAATRHISLPMSARTVEEGLDGRLYALGRDNSGIEKALQINSTSGEVLTFAPRSMGEELVLRMAADRRTLYISDQGADPAIVKYDVTGTTPVLVQSGPRGWLFDDVPRVRHDGKAIVGAGQISGGADATFEIPTADITDVTGGYKAGGPVTYSNDDSLLYFAFDDLTGVKIFDTTSHNWIGTIAIKQADVTDVVVDKSGQWLVLGTTHYPYPNDPNAGEVRIYPTGRADALHVAPQPTPTVTPQPSGTPSATPQPTLAPAQSQNISTRVNVLTGDNVLIGGFIITGDTPTKVLLRAIAPSLPIANSLADPVLELHTSDGRTVTNNDWKINDVTHQSQEAEVRATTIPPSDDHESALVATLAPGPYTAIVHGNNNATGIGLVEVYNLDASPGSSLANISTRGFVDTDSNVMIGGFIIGPPNSTTTSRIAVRAIGSSTGVSGALQDPVLEVHDANGSVMATNDNWQDDPSAADVNTHQLAPADARESALIRTLNPGAYTAVVRGANQTTGVALVEIYNLR